MLLSTIGTGFTSSAGLIVCIGSQNAFVLRQGLQRTHLFAVASVCILSDVILISAGISGLGFLIDEWPSMIQLMRFGGALFLAINAFSAFKRAWAGTGKLTPSEQTMASRNQIILSCIGYTWLNPHVYIDTVLMLGSLSMHYVGMEKWKFGLGAISASALWFIAITYGARLLLPLFKTNTAWRVLDGAIAVMMIYLCVTLLIPSQSLNI
ncbi:amino acid transporter [Vibrio sp. CAIM 722]|uniref:Amino acid transporter n=1 Tax=Vibrio eleionomae TaxID=2653505 RepID=A0A7X4LPM2_9VIBR|nr:LysE/ArgO family amino acid transporter [Vibrio eleionomae]MZI95689.1 amino acid transporter [Vibrio eleionomae]